MTEYFLHIWGGAIPTLEKLYGIKEEYYWFKTFEERRKFINKIRKHSKLGLAIDTEEGEMTHKRTIAEMDLLYYKDKIYHIKYDFGYEYPEDAARFMFFEGNYSCACNLSSFIQDQCDENFPDLECYDEDGNEQIEIQNFVIKYED